MLEQKDLQSIGELLDKKLKTQEQNITQKFDGKLDEAINIINKGFTDMQKEINGVKEEVKLRPTKTEIFNWADKRLIDLELKADRHDYLHINELDKLPPQSEISRALIEQGLKKKIA